MKLDILGIKVNIAPSLRAPQGRAAHLQQYP
jgi:hypothetical protein